MKFLFKNFTCDVEVFARSNDFVFRLYDKSKEHTANQIQDLVIVDPGFGYLCLKIKDDHGALLSGFLDDKFFDDDELLDSLISFIFAYVPKSKNCYVPYHIRRFKASGYVEYNGEY